uniref:GRIP domain-containing protein n=1 Tax=Pinguiococcus pyrenoidosus TaxID=172671 RepID=A0A7R9U638_9STRA|mmetsp:Transcript_16161/g.61630  ORF Transcript_16161/g.61630 Transcript_16161/m.61630 type:complete len:155 (+) Transcript_16161:158-622(+)
MKETLEHGSPENRQVMEIARAQANRDAEAQREAENRDIALARLQAVVEAKDLELANLTNKMLALRRDIETIQTRQHREVSGGVNAEYLKNVLVEYLSFPAGSSERKVLFPVLAMLLQFDQSDLHRISEGSASVAPRQVKDISHNARRRSTAQIG